MRNALLKMSNTVTDNDIEDLSRLAFHIESLDDEGKDVFRKFHDILDCYCTDYDVIGKIADVIKEACGK